MVLSDSGFGFNVIPQCEKSLPHFWINIQAMTVLEALPVCPSLLTKLHVRCGGSYVRAVTFVLSCSRACSVHHISITDLLHYETSQLRKYDLMNTIQD